MKFVPLEGPTSIIRVCRAYTGHSLLTSLNGNGMIPRWRTWGKMRENRSKAQRETG